MMRTLSVATGLAGSRPEWAKIAGHSHTLRNTSVPIEEAFGHLVEWERRHGVTAIGLGSPWTSRSGAFYGRCEHEDRDRYFAGLVSDSEREELLCREDIHAMIRAANEASGGSTLHYLDNETPKQRYGHMWHVGFQLQVPAWHDYDQDRRASYCDLDPVEDPNPLDPRGAHYRRTYSEVTALQRAAGAISIWAHPTSWWDGPDGRYYTNIAAAMPPNLYADGFLDGLVVQGYDPYHRDYQALWFDLLDRGWRVPGFSELDLCPCREIRGKGCALFNCVPGMASHGGDVTLDAIIAAMRAANHTMSSGPYLTLSVDGVRQGGSVRSGAGVTHVAVVEAWPAPGQSALARVELLGRGGAVLASVDDFPGGRVTFMFEGDANGGWVAARVFGEHDGDYASKRQQAVLHCALTNPVVLDAPHTPHPASVTTHVRLSSDGCEGASLRLVAADGSELWRRELPEAGLEFDASPTSRLEIGQPDGAPSRVLPLAAANRRVRDLMDYLADGRFRRDWPGLEPGEVPVAAFHLDGFRTAMTELVLSARKA